MQNYESFRVLGAGVNTIRLQHIGRDGRSTGIKEFPIAGDFKPSEVILADEEPEGFRELMELWKAKGRL